jgi:hypothetical protein
MTTRTTNRNVAAAFAKGQAATSNNKQLFTDGRVIYSYGHHWPIAIRHNGTVYVNEDRYSMTTSKHTGMVRAALAYAGILAEPISRERALILANGSQL